MSSDRKIHVGLLYGGKSCEHEVSVTSARCIYAALDRDKYEISLLGIAKSGEWVLNDRSPNVLEAKTVEITDRTRVRLDYADSGELVACSDNHIEAAAIPALDVVFPVLHGPFGEDGTVQGLMELAGIAYVGSGVTGSAVGMDKAVTKAVCAAEHIPQADYLVYRKSHWLAQQHSVVQQIESELDYPIFVKPANLGSSVGISKAKNVTELKLALDHAVQFDTKIVVEQGMENCHEIEVSVLGNDNPQASVVGEIVPGGEFYDYQDKYINHLSKSVIPAELPPAVVSQIQDYAIRAFLATDAAGLARVDFFVNREDFSIYINEINTMPGFTPISMYPKLWEASGIGYSELLDRLIELALERRELMDQRKLVL